MSCRRGITLIEVVLAAALLALIAATVVPLLRGSSATAPVPIDLSGRSTLIESVDLLLAEPDARGLDTDPLQWDGSVVRDDALTIDITVHRPEASDTRRVWITFSTDTSAIHRVLTLSEDE